MLLTSITCVLILIVSLWLQILEMLSKIEDELSMQLCTAERSLLYSLEGGCQVRLPSLWFIYCRMFTLVVFSRSLWA